MLDSILLASALLFTTSSTSDPSCEEEQRVIEALEAELDEADKTIQVAEEFLVDLYLAHSDPTTASCDGKSGTELHVCQCLAEGNGAGNGLTQCVDAKAGSPTGGV